MTLESWLPLWTDSTAWIVSPDQKTWSPGRTFGTGMSARSSRRWGCVVSSIS